MEDCLRCDACSCIYIDRNDYYKHMRNFHKYKTDVQFDSTKTAAVESIKLFNSTPSLSSIKPQNKQVNSLKKKCLSCCKQCQGIYNSGKPHQLDHAIRANRRTSSNELFQFSMQDNIKDRWSKIVSQRLIETEEELQQIKIKSDPDSMEIESSVQSSIIDSDDRLHLLSQVEVKIKVEPPDDMIIY